MIRASLGLVVIGLVAAGALSSSGCTLTLPLDEVSGGVPKPSSSYSFEEQTGTVVGDSFGRRPATFYGEPKLPIWTRAGKRGGGVEFGDDGWLGIPALAGPTFPASGTLAFWVKLTAFPATASEDDELDLFTVEEADESAPIYAMVNAKGEIELQAYAGEDERTVVSPPIRLGAWHLVAFGWDAPRRLSMLSVRAEGAAAFVRAGELPPAFKLTSPDVTVVASKGAIDEMRFWDRMLSASELALLAE